MEIKIDKNTKKLFKEKGIKLVVIFGSFLYKKDSFSDIDIAVLPSFPSNLNLYNEMYKIFSDLFSSFHKEVDIVFLDKAPLPLKFEIVTSGKPIYEYRNGFFLDYKEKIMKEYIDFKFHLDKFKEAIIEVFK